MINKPQERNVFLAGRQIAVESLGAMLAAKVAAALKDEGRKAADKRILSEILTVIETGEVSGELTMSETTSFSLSPQEWHWLDRHDEEKWLAYLLYRYRFKLLPTRRELLDFPIYVLIEPTSVCNLRCIMCFQSDQSFQTPAYRGFMAWDLFVKVAQEAKANGCCAVTLASRGEPTLHPEFGKMLAYLKELDFLDVKINTNATVLTDKLIHEILSAEVSEVVFSVDEAEKKEYERIRPGANFDRVVAQIERFHEIRRRDYPRSPTTSRIMAIKVGAGQDTQKISDFWAKRVDEVAIKRAVARWDAYHNEPTDYNRPCPSLWSRLYVWHDGTVNPCDFDYKSKLAVGDVKKQSLKEIWQGPAFTRLRQDHLAGKKKEIFPCDRCDIS